MSKSEEKEKITAELKEEIKIEDSAVEEIKKELQALKESFNDSKIEQICSKMLGEFINKFNFTKSEPKTDQVKENPKTDYEQKLENWKL